MRECSLQQFEIGKEEIMCAEVKMHELRARHTSWLFHTKNQQVKEYIQYDTIYTKFKDIQN